MADLNLGKFPLINFDQMDAEVRAALPDKVRGLTYADDVLTAQVADDDAEALRPQIEAVIAAHDPSVKTAAQQEDEARETTRRQLEQADFAKWKADVQNAASLAALRPLLLQLGRVVWMLAKAQGLTRASDPEAA